LGIKSTVFTIGLRQGRCGGVRILTNEVQGLLEIKDTHRPRVLR